MTPNDSTQTSCMIQKLSQKWKQSQARVKRILEESYLSMYEKADPLDKLIYAAAFQSKNPSTEQIVMQIKPLIEESITKSIRLTPRELTQAWIVIRFIAEKYTKTPMDVRNEMQRSIDDAWRNSAGKAAQMYMFPKGKPSAEEFLIRCAKQLR